jgi:hypothetical protein
MDRYVLIGDRYARLKDSLNKCFQEQSSADLEALIEKDKDLLFPYLAMAVYKNVTTLNKDVTNLPVERIAAPLNKYYVKHKHHWQPLLENSLGHNLKINTANWKHIELSLLLVQLKYSVLFSRSNVIKPLASLIERPAEHKDYFLPCMPQDSLFDIQNAIKQAAQVTNRDNPTFYACPNGHPYVLFDCGRPWVKMKCDVCGTEIGGAQHVLLPTNRVLNVTDNTQKGYCLPVASSLPDAPANERELNSTAFHILRFFVHACLYVACERSEKYVDEIMSTKSADKKQFFWDHMNKDIKIAAKTININADEMLTLLHVICMDILKNVNNGNSLLRERITEGC